MIDLTIRSFSRARWLAVATSRGVYDASGNVAEGYAVDEIGSLLLAPAVPDTWHTVNLRIYGSKWQDDYDAILMAGESEEGLNFHHSKLVKWIRNQSTPIGLLLNGQTVRTYQFGTRTNSVQLLDPRDYSTIRQREWFGGMEF